MRCCSIETRNEIILQKIVGFCQRIKTNLERFNFDYHSFETDYLFQDTCCMCVVQIGELVGQLSDDVKCNAPTIPWRAIKDTRNFYVHAYGSIDLPSVWETLVNDIPLLATACEELLSNT